MLDQVQEGRLAPVDVVEDQDQGLDTRQGLLLAYTAFAIPFVVWVMRDFFRGLPVEVEECALLDGCDATILVDAIHRGGPPGTLHVIDRVAESDAW